MRILRQLLSVARQDRQRNPDIRKSSTEQANRGHKSYQKRWLDHLERTGRSCLPKLAFQYQPWGRRDARRPFKGGKIKNILSFKGTGVT
jgi:hypothetical protein